MMRENQHSVDKWPANAFAYGGNAFPDHHTCVTIGSFLDAVLGIPGFRVCVMDASYPRIEACAIDCVA